MKLTRCSNAGNGRFSGPRPPPDGAGYWVTLVVLCIGCLSAYGASAKSDSAQYKEYEIKAVFIYNFLKFVEWPEEKMARNGNQVIVGIIGDDPFGEAVDVFKDKKVDERDVVVRRFDGLSRLKEAVEKDKAELEQKVQALRMSYVVFRDKDGNITMKPLDEFEELKNITDAAAREKKLEELKKRGLFLADPSKEENLKVIVNTLANERLEPVKRCHLLFICPSEKNNAAEITELVKGHSVVTVADSSGFLEAGGVINFVLEENKIRFEINLTAAEKTKLEIRSQLLRLAKKVFKNGAEVTGASAAATKEETN